MVAISVRTNFPEVQRKLDRLQSDIGTKALASAVNKTLALSRTEMSKQIRAEFNLSASKVREKLHIRKATFKAGRFSIEGSFSSSTKGGRRAINVINFAARQGLRGVTVKIKKQGARKTIKGAFTGNAGRTVFRRVGKERLPIDPVQTIDVPQMFNTRRINVVVRRFMQERFPAIFDRDVRFYMGKFNRG